MDQLLVDDSLDLAEFFSMYLDSNDSDNILDTIDNNESNNVIMISEPEEIIKQEIESQPQQTEQEITALVIRKEHYLLTPEFTYKIEKGFQMSIRSFFISLTLTFLNLFI